MRTRPAKGDKYQITFYYAFHSQLAKRMRRFECSPYQQLKWSTLCLLSFRISETCISVRMLDWCIAEIPSRKSHRLQPKTLCAVSRDSGRDWIEKKKKKEMITKISSVVREVMIRVFNYLRNSSRFPCSAAVHISENPPVYVYPKPTTNASENASTVAWLNCEAEVQYIAVFFYHLLFSFHWEKR